MEKFSKNISENTLPLILYLISSFLVVFITNLNVLILISVLFLFISFFLFGNKVLSRIILITSITIFVILTFSILISWDFSYKRIIISLPKAISLSVMISSVIAFFVYVPTVQLFFIAKTFTRSNRPAYAILTGFRTFPVFFNFSKKIFTTIKIRKAYSSLTDLILLYIQNIFIEFFAFLDNFINHFSFIELNKIKHKNNLNYKFFLIILYFIFIIKVIYYGK
jgi:hypothetical protein